MKILCPHCGVKGSADDSYSGRKVKCPKCTTVFEVKSDMALDLTEESNPAIEQAIETETRTGGEESLDWEDIASEVDLNSPDVEIAEIELEEVAADLNTLHDDSEEPGEDASLSDFFDELPEAVPLETGGDELETLSEPILEAVGAESLAQVNEIEQEPYGVDTEECWQCGKKGGAGESFIAKDGRLYCNNCVPVEKMAEPEEIDLEVVEEETLSQFDDGSFAGAAAAKLDLDEDSPRTFSIKEALREAWENTKGAKGAIWAGSSVMYFIVLIVVAGGAYLLPGQSVEQPVVTGMLSNAIYQIVTNAIIALFTAGLMFIGIRKVAGDPISWKMTFRGFASSGKIIIATILQTILVTIGFLLLILPGIYLTVGYSMTLPLILDKNLSPWQALETSRKAVHKVWWKVAGLLLIMGLLLVVSIIPLGIGLIWTWPMFIIMTGVIYHYLFDDGRRID